MVEEYCTAIKFWVDQTRDFGIDPWLITTAIIQQRRICEVPLGFRMEYASLDKVSYVFKDFAAYMFESIRREEEYWKEKRVVLRSPDIYGLEPYQDIPVDQTYDTRALIHFFRNGFNQYRDLLMAACPQNYIQHWSAVSLTDPGLSPDGRTWANTVYSLLSHYSFDPTQKRGCPGGSHRSFLRRMEFLEHLEALQEELASEKALMLLHSFQPRREQEGRTAQVLPAWQHQLHQAVERKIMKHKPSYPCGLPGVYPRQTHGPSQGIKWRGDQEVCTADLFSRLQVRYTEKFHDFLENDLLISADANSTAIASRLEEYMEELEQTIDHLSPGNVYTEEGTREAVEGIFQLIGHPKIFGIKEDIFEEALLRFPPLNIMIPEGCHTPRELLDKMLPRDAVTIANLIETRKWADRTLLWILENLNPEDMEK